MYPLEIIKTIRHVGGAVGERLLVFFARKDPLPNRRKRFFVFIFNGAPQELQSFMCAGCVVRKCLLDPIFNNMNKLGWHSRGIFLSKAKAMRFITCNCARVEGHTIDGPLSAGYGYDKCNFCTSTTIIVTHFSESRRTTPA